MKLHKHFYIAIGILLVAAILGEVYFRWLVKAGIDEVVPLNKPLSSIPVQLGDWRGLDVTIAPDVLLVINAEDVLQRTYYLGKEQQLAVYIAYFAGIRGMAPHRPDVCRPGAGWKNISSEVVALEVPGFGGGPLQVHKDLYEKQFEKQVVIWWEYVHGKNIANRTLQRLQWALPSFLGGKGGSILQVQISLGFRDSMEESMHRVIDFMSHLGPHVQKVLPVEGTTEEAKVATEDDRRP